jgi:hypothetical protein
MRERRPPDQRAVPEYPPRHHSAGA